MSAFRLIGPRLASSRHRICAQAARLPQVRHRAMASTGGPLPATALVGIRRMSSYNFKAHNSHDDGDAEKSVIVAARKPVHHHQEVLEEEETVDEGTMKKRFEEWMLKWGRTYKDEKEKATRYEIFKRTARFVDEHNARRTTPCSATFETNDFADRTKEELSWMCGGRSEPHYGLEFPCSTSEPSAGHGPLAR